VTSIVHKYAYAVPGAADVGDIAPTDAELRIHRHANLLAWSRASVNLVGDTWRDRSRGVEFDKTARANDMPVKTIDGGLYNGKPYLYFANTNPVPEMRSADDVMPASGSFTLAWVGHWSDAAAQSRYNFFGSPADSGFTSQVCVNSSTGRIELFLGNGTQHQTGSGAFVATVDVPFLAVVSLNVDTDVLRIVANRGENDDNKTSVTDTWGPEQQLQIGCAGSDSFGQQNRLRDGGLAEFMVFDFDIFSDADLLADVHEVFGDRYGFAAP
jgi:hypothetical protein